MTYVKQKEHSFGIKTTAFTFSVLENIKIWDVKNVQPKICFTQSTAVLVW